MDFGSGLPVRVKNVMIFLSVGTRRERVSAKPFLGKSTQLLCFLATPVTGTVQ
jgi:hypothetical protein